MTDSDYGFKQQMAVNVKWVGIGMVFSYILQFSVWAVLARFLLPESFGALGIALAFSNLAVILNELGFGTALIQKKSLSEKHKAITFWVCVFMGIFFLCLAVLFSSFIAKFFQNPVIVPLTIVIFVKNLIDCFGIVNESILKKELLFKKLTFIEIWSSILFGIVALGMVLKGFDILSLAYGYMAKSSLKVIMLWKNVSFKIFEKFNRKSFGELFNYSKNIIGSRAANYITDNADIVFIGKLLGPASLGYYSMALNIVNFPRLKLSYIISQVAFPAFSRLQDYRGELNNAYNKLVRYASIMNFPLLVGLIFVSPQFVNVIFSSKWNVMILPLQILCVYGICFSITTFAGIIFNSAGYPQYSFKYSLMSLICLITAIIIGVKYNLTGVAVALSIYAIVMNIIGNLMVCRIIKMKFKTYLRSLVPALSGSAVMSLALLLIVKLRNSAFIIPDLYLFTSMMFIGALVYGLTLLVCFRKTFWEIMGLVKGILFSI